MRKFRLPRDHECAQSAVISICVKTALGEQSIHNIASWFECFSSTSGVTCDIIPNYVMKSLPMVRVRKESRLLYPGVQCRICLSRFQLGQQVRTLPCKHKFHTGCIDPLLRKSNCCPLDWHIIYNPLMWNPKSGRTERSLAPSSDVLSKHTDDQISEFFLPAEQSLNLHNL
ncbi:E3 ubiquitin- ligase ZSWIM2 [Labeo rohita]|uniref:E3 ubiquitin-ligase ZSWIM2 n=1 Tax=Labeo rohita TaxID=84645 RepID=A0A498LX50_LABRO|nr:E3 ubiquitin- ligase ZSWIM2 [Labeo rohita]RXN33489.1 E3 ubiquitin- ligase ZSWIM2 [Labeo rohita]